MPIIVATYLEAKVGLDGLTDAELLSKADTLGIPLSAELRAVLSGG